VSQKSQELSIKRRAIREAVRKAIQQIQNAKDKMLKLGFQDFEVVASLCPMSLLLGTSVAPKVGRPLTDFVEVIQGVTWGGKDAEQVFDLKEQDVKRLSLEHEVTLKRIGGEDVKRWRIEWTRRYALFPYVANKNKWSRAFELIGEDVAKPIGISDALDFEQVIDDVERRIHQQDSPESEKLRA
jgi:hypothetical protein